MHEFGAKKHNYIYVSVVSYLDIYITLKIKNRFHIKDHLHTSILTYTPRFSRIMDLLVIQVASNDILTNNVIKRELR